MEVKSAQLRVLNVLLRASARTAYARYLDLPTTLTYDGFIPSVPICAYDDLKPWVERCKSGEPDVLWPGIVRSYAVSAGTTGIGKHIPIYEDRLQSDLSFMRRVMRHVLRDNPDPGLFLGKHIALTGSVEHIDGLLYGEISGMLACASPKWIRPWHTICPERAAFMSWPDRYKALLEASVHSNVRVLTGVPSWILIFLRDVSHRAGKHIEHVWPNLKLIVTGGVALSGYHNLIHAELGGLNVRFLENYGASEGYFAFDWYESGSMLLQYNSDIFYEFIPVEMITETRNTHSLEHHCIPLWEVQPNVPYALVVTNIGLQRYLTNDVVLFDTIDTPRLRVTGRLNEMTDTFGEAVTKSDVEEVIQHVMPKIRFNRMHVRPIWSDNPPLPSHEWIFVISEPDAWNILRESISTLPVKIDDHLRSINRHYAIRRDTGAIGLPSIRTIDMDEYDTLMRAQPKSQSKLGMFIR